MLKIFNTLTRKLENFRPIIKKKIFMYVCGATVYKNCHIGHARTFIFFDVVFRYLKHLGYSVNYIRNITDIDDKIIEKSFKKKVNFKIFVNDIIESMNKDFSKLNLLKPTYEPRVTHFVNEIIYFIKKLIKLKFAYIKKNGDVFFSVKKYYKYGELSNKKKNINNILRKNNLNFNKKDFVLWKIYNINKPFWKSPWGYGRPGWHIECSAINYKFCKFGLDIHGGGNDLIFPHHENERAQSESFLKNKKKYSKFWMHTGMVIQNKKKMSKSLNNSIYIKNLLKNYHPEVIRYYFLSVNYKHPVFFDFKNLKQSQKQLKKLYFSIEDLNFSDFYLKNKKIVKSSQYYKKFFKIMNDDFNTGKVLKLFFKLSKKINFLKNFFSKNSFKIKKYSSILFKLGKLIGFFQSVPKTFLNKNIMKYYSKSDLKIIYKLFNRRVVARNLKMWKLSDKLRNKLKKFGLKVEDNLKNTVLVKS